MNRQAGLSQLPYQTGRPVQQAGLAAAPPFGAPEVSGVNPAATMTMQDRTNLISGMVRQGLDADSIRHQLVSAGLLRPQEPVEEIAPPLEDLSLWDVTKQGARQMAAMGTEGLGAIGERAFGLEGARQAGADIGQDLFGLTDEEQEARARRAEGQSFMGEVRDAMAGSAGLTAAIMGGGALGGALGSALGPAGTAVGATAGRKLGATLGALLPAIPTMVGSALERARDNNLDTDDPEVQSKAIATGIARGYLEIWGIERLGSAILGPATDAVQRSLASAAARGAGKYATIEAAAEAAGDILEIAVFDPEIRAQLSEGELAELTQYFGEHYGRETAIGVVAGAGMGGGIGAPGATIQQSRVNAQRASDVETLAAVADEGGVPLETLQAAARDPEQAPALAAAAREIGAVRRELATATTVLDAAVETQDPEVITEAEARFAELVKKADAVYDRVMSPFGAMSAKDIEQKKVDQTERARKALINADLVDPNTAASLDRAKITSYAQAVSTAQDRADAAEAAAKDAAALEPEARAEVETELQAARAELRKVRDQIAIDTGKETPDSIKRRDSRAKEDEAYDGAVRRQYERKFGDMIARGDTEAAAAEARRIVDTVGADADKGLRAAITKLEKQLDTASTVEKIDKIEADIAEKRSRLGRPAPIVAAARRVLDDVASQQVGADAQGSSPATARQSTEPEATPVTATQADGTEAAATALSPEPEPTAATAPVEGAVAPAADALARLRTANNQKTVGDPADAIAAAPLILQQARDAREGLGIDPDAAPGDAWAAGAGRDQLGFERDLQNALGLPLDATPAQMEAALAARTTPETPAATKPETPAAAKPSVPELVRQARERLAQRNETADRLARDDAPVRMKSKTEGQQALVSPAPDRPGRWRITYLDAQGPSGHTDHADKRSAVLDALTQGYAPETAAKVSPEPETAASVEPELTPEQVQAQAKATADTEATQAKLDRKYEKPKAPEFTPDKRQGAGNNYTDLLDVFGRRTATATQATEFVRENGARTGHEYYVAIDRATGEVLGAGTNHMPALVFPSAAAVEALRQGRDVTVVHNHPRSTTLSGGDMAFLYRYPGTLRITAVAADGSTYTAEPTDLGRKVFGADASTMIEKLAAPNRKSSLARRMLDRTAQAWVEAGLINADPNGRVSAADTGAIVGGVRRAINRAMAQEGLMSYIEAGPFELRTTKEQAAYDQGVKHARKAIRDAYALSTKPRPTGAAAAARNVERSRGVRTRRSGPAGNTRRGSGTDGTGLAEPDGAARPAEVGAGVVDGRSDRGGRRSVARKPRPDETVAGLTPTRAYETSNGATVYEVAAPEQFTQLAADAVATMGPVGAQVGTDPGTRQFLFNDGQSGFALDGDNIISVFTTDGAPSGVISTALELGVDEGGRRLDAFDTFLPDAYARRGFRAVARLPFNREFAPEEWDYEFFDANFGNSDPDVVFMAHDPANASPDTSNTIDDYGDGEAAQRAALEAQVLAEPPDPTLIRKDNPGGRWLEGKQERAAQDMRDAPSNSFRSKGLGGSVTSYTRQTIFLPVDMVADVPGAQNEQRAAGDPKYDHLKADVARRGFLPGQDGNAILVGVNHLGQAYLLEGNTRVAVAKETGVDTIRAEVRWFNGGERAAGEFTPDVVAQAALPDDAPGLGEEADLPPVHIARVRSGQGAGRQHRTWYDFSQQIDPTISPTEAAAEVLRRGADGFEHAVVTRVADGAVLGAGTNRSRNAVASSDAAIDYFRTDIAPAMLTHNHPDPTPLSFGDMQLLFGSASDLTTVAVLPDGAREQAQLTPAARAMDFGTRMDVLHRAEESIYARMRGDGMQAAIARASALNRALAQAGAIEYTPGLPDPTRSGTQEAINATVATLNDTHPSLRDARDTGRPQEQIGSSADDQGTVGPDSVRSDGPDGAGPVEDVAAGGAEVASEGFAETQSVPELQVAAEKYKAAEKKARKTLEPPAWLAVETQQASTLKSAVDNVRTKGAAARAATFLETQIVNRLVPLRNYELGKKGALDLGMDSMYKAAEIAVNDPGRNEALLYYGAAQRDPATGGYRVAQDTIGLHTMLKKLPDGQAVMDWMEYMGARRAQEIRSKGLTTPLTDADIEAGLAKESKLFREVAADWKKFNDANVDFLVDTGRISRALGATLKADAAYVPFYRAEDTVTETFDLLDEAGIKSASLSRRSGAVLNRDPGIKKLTGGENRKVNNIIQNMIRNSQAMVAAGMRNQAANTSFEVMRATGDVRLQPARVETRNGNFVPAPMPDHAVRMYRKGKEYYVVPQTVDAIPVMLALAGMQPTRLGGIAKVMAAIGSFFRQSITLSPAFVVRNMIRDAVSTGVLFSGKNLTMEHNMFKGMVSSLRHSASRQAFSAASGMGDFRFGGTDIGFGKDDMLIELGVMKPTQLGWIGYRFRQAVSKMEALGTASELSNRIAIYEALVSEGVRSDEAAYQALTITNYSRRGANEQLQTLLPLVPFLNARIQGLSRIWEDATTKRGADRTKALARLALNGAILSTVSALLWGWNNSDEERREDYNSEPLHRRLNYHIIYIGDRKVMIPKAFEVGTLFGTVPEILMRAAIEKDTSELGAATLMTLTNTFAFNPIPQAIMPALEILTDYNFFTGRPIEGQRLSGMLREDRINPQTSALAIGLAKSGLGSFTGLSPVAVDHLLAGYGGVAYTSLATAIDTAAGEMGLLPARPDGVFGSIPVVNTALENTFQSMFKQRDADPSNRWVEDFYQTRAAITQIYRSARDAAINGDVERARRLLSAAPATPAAYKFMNKAGTQLSELNAAIRQVRGDEKMSGTRKRELLNTLVQERNKVSAQVMEVIRKAEEAQGTSFRRAAR